MLKAQKYAYFGVEDILKMKKNSEMNETMSHSRNKKSDILNSCANSQGELDTLLGLPLRKSDDNL